jgi:hypothetical protein
MLLYINSSVEATKLSKVVTIKLLLVLVYAMMEEHIKAINKCTSNDSLKLCSNGLSLPLLGQLSILVDAAWQSIVCHCCRCYVEGVENCHWLVGRYLLCLVLVVL